MEVLTGALVLITGFYAWVTYHIMVANRRTLETMNLQAEAISRPYVEINVFSVPNSVIFHLRIANTGKTGASDVRLTLDRDFHQYGQKNRPSLRQATVFQQPIEQLPPGAEMIFGLAQAFVVLGDEADAAVTPPVFSITAEYSFAGKRVVERTTIDLRPYKESMDRPSAVADELKKIREQLEKLVSKR